ncbi:SCO family protein [Arenibacter sp. ARW7G5Y1]|mgnify:FL=1|uniref:SCO family protein n=1 Tax=Arenibacter sp. ARW7G5Y1 TaxID=2135619 RepID=UPI000D9B35E2|nr:SCO family protein [Arenibacter sp. ARW7G5Y1]PXX30569.1 protein SCO1/2 [Arenibacter sp. ARW7G5Y1]|tara:strand:- start:1408 stop:2112 length:705 start_codon:yes stop_codon:yes gene_type:complete
MKKILHAGLICFLAIHPIGCNTKNSTKTTAEKYQCPMHCEGDKTYDKPGTCGVCKMDLQLLALNSKKEGEISDMSIYNLPSKWTNQNNGEIQLKSLKGDVLVMVMIYTSCQTACPRLVADMRGIEEQIPEDKKDQVTLVFVSIDPETDTPQRLKEFAQENQMDSEKWVFLRGSEADTREFSAVLAVNYKKISPMDFSHSNIISVFDQEGELAYQQEGLGVNNKETVSKIMELVN